MASAAPAAPYKLFDAVQPLSVLAAANSSESQFLSKKKSHSAKPKPIDSSADGFNSGDRLKTTLLTVKKATDKAALKAAAVNKATVFVAPLLPDDGMP